MHRFAALGLVLLAACEPRAAEPRSHEPSKQTEAEANPAVEPALGPAVGPAAEPAVGPAVGPADKRSSEVAAVELPAVAGVHYLEFVTANADPNAELPMIIAIHGLGDTPENFASLLTRFDQPARVILPRALDPYEPGWSWFPLRARDADVETLAAGIDRATDTLAVAIAELVEQRPTRGKPIVTGFSQGGMLSFALAVEHGELFAAAFPVGGWLPPPLWPDPDPDRDPKQAPPILALHGEDDVAVPIQPTRDAVANLQKAGYVVSLNEYPGVGHAIPEVIHADLIDGIRDALTKLPGHEPAHEPAR